MDILDKIVELRKERNWTEYQLAEKAGLAQSTISTWYRKRMIPTIPSLEKICDAFGITLSEFFLDKNFQSDYIVQLTSEQYDIMEATSKLDSAQKKALLAFLKLL